MTPGLAERGGGVAMEQELGKALIENDVALFALKQIARGKKNCGLPLPRETAQQIARISLVALGEDW